MRVANDLTGEDITIKEFQDYVAKEGREGRIQWIMSDV